MKSISDTLPEDAEQNEGNYNVFCQSCGQIVAINIQSQKDALELEERHTKDTRCRYSGTHVIRPQEEEKPNEF